MKSLKIETKHCLLKELIDITTKYCDAPKVFHEALAYHVLSVTLGQFFEMPDMKCGRPNVWFVMSCMPGRGRRSTIMGYNYKLLFSALKEYYIQTDTFKVDEAGIKVWNSIIEDGTPQGVCDCIIEGLESGFRTFELCSGEFGDILKRITSDKHYTSGMDTLLSRLYYGEQYKESLSQRKHGESRFIPPDLYVTMFASMQEPQHYLTKKMSAQGLLRRMRIIYVKPSDFSMDNWKPPYQDEFGGYKKDIREFTQKELVPRMIKYNNMLTKARKSAHVYDIDNTFLRVDMNETTRKKISDMSRKVDEDVINDPSDYNIYQQTRWEHITKYTILNAIAKDAWGGMNTFIYCKDEHINEALEFDKVIDKHTMEMMDKIGFTERHRIDETMFEKIERNIRRTGSDGIRRSDLLNSLPGVKADDLQDFLDTLLIQEKITVITTSPKRQGRTGTIYVSMNFLS